MPRFEVSCPATPPALPADVAVRVEAEHWLAALKAGLQKAGAPPLGSNVLCDVQADGSIRVTDPAGGGVFRVAELRSEPPPPAPLPRDAAVAPGPILPRPREARETGARGCAAPLSTDEILAELFERVADLARHRDRKGGLGFLLDLALEKVGAEAGSAFLAGLGARELSIAAARGPRAQELIGETVPMGAGVVGFSVQENVALAVSDAGNDPRFYAATSAAIGYETRSLLCAPIARKGRVLGALELVNKRGGASFDKGDLAVLSYLAHQAAAFLDRFGG